MANITVISIKTNGRGGQEVQATYEDFGFNTRRAQDAIVKAHGPGSYRLVSLVSDDRTEV